MDFILTGRHEIIFSDTTHKTEGIKISIMASMKYIIKDGFYAGAGLSLKYLKSDGETSWAEAKWNEKIDLWANLIAGYYFPINELVSANIEGRLGVNITNKQVSVTNSFQPKYEHKSSNEAVIFVGCGYKL